MLLRRTIAIAAVLAPTSALRAPIAQPNNAAALTRRAAATGLATATFAAAVATSPPAAFAAAATGSDGKWARRYDEFTDADFEGFKTSPSGLQYKVVEEGYGVKPLAGQKIKAHYAGYLLNGAKFDASWDRGKPLEFKVGVGMVIKGWDEALLDMQVGEKRMLKIPPALGYGSRGAGGVIPPDATLIFYVELVTLAA